MQNTIAQQIKALLNNVSTTFAQVGYSTKVNTAAAHKAVSIVKVTNANVQLFSNIKAATSVFANAVKKSAAKLGEEVQSFQVSDTYFEHTDCYSIVEHKTKGSLYLYCIYNNSKSAYFINGAPATKAEVAAYLTPSAAKALLEPTKVVHNKTNDVTHDVVVRTIGLDNITSIKACKEQLVF